MDLIWFKDLAALDAAGSFSRAAERTHISQSALSRRIKALESWVGAQLVDRSHQPVRLTTAGTQILEAGMQAVLRIENEREQIRAALEQPDRYVVTFGTQHSIGWRFFPAWLQAFESAFGPFMSRLRADNLPNCIEDLNHGEVDFVISYESANVPGLQGSPGIDTVRIGTDQLIPVSVPDTNGNPLFRLDGAADTAIPTLGFGRDAPIGQHLAPIIAALESSQRLSRIYENSMTGALRIRARDGLGLAWLPRTLVAPDLTSKQLCIAGANNWWVDLDICLHKRSDNDNRITGSIMRFLDEQPGPLAPGGL